MPHISPAHSSNPITCSCSSKGSLTSAWAVGMLKAFSFSCTSQSQVSGVGPVTLTAAASYFIASPAGLWWPRKSCSVGEDSVAAGGLCMGMGAHQVMLMRGATPDISSCACAVGSWATSKLKHYFCWVSTLPVLKHHWPVACGVKASWKEPGLRSLLNAGKPEIAVWQWKGSQHTWPQALEGGTRWLVGSASGRTAPALPFAVYESSAEARDWVLPVPEQPRR